MNENESACLKSLCILSTKKSNNQFDGSFITKGGVGIGKNLYVNDEVIASELISKGNIKSNGNLYINGDIIIGDLFITLNNTIYIKKNLEPFNGINCDIGSYCNKINKIYSKNIVTNVIKVNEIDILDEISIGNNKSVNEPIFRIDKNIINSIIINGNMAFIDTDKNIFLSIEQDKNIDIHCPINIDHLFISNYLSITPQFTDINEDNYILRINSSIIFLTLLCNSFISFDLTPVFLSKNLIIKLILYSNDQNYSINIINIKTLLNKNDYIELLFYDNNFLLVTSNVI